MSRYYHRRFRVRGYEVDATGRVHDSVYLNYIQQAAFEASADAGYDTRRYAELGTIWVIRQQTIAFLASLFYDDVLELTTWVSDVRRVRSRREYELRRVSDQLPVAVACVDWVYIDAETNYPRRIPADVIEAFQPNNRSALDAASELQSSQVVDAPSFVYQHRVKSYELDNLRHVNNANYLNWLNQARLDALAEVGLPLDRQSSQLGNLNAVFRPVRFEIEYFVPAVAGDIVLVHSQVVGTGGDQLAWGHRIYRDQELLVEAKATVCLCGARNEVLPVPDAVVQTLIR